MKRVLVDGVSGAVRRRATRARAPSQDRRATPKPFLLPDRRISPILENLAPKELRRTILSQSKRADTGHIGSCLCVVEILAAIYTILNASTPSDPDRDRFVLSKGHAALALYAALAARNWISQAELEEFCGEGSRIAVHPEHTVAGVDF